MLKSFSEERVEMRVCETRRSASYRSVTAVSEAFWTVPLITIGGNLTAFHTCLTRRGAKQRSSGFRDPSTRYTPAGKTSLSSKEGVHLHTPGCSPSGTRAKTPSPDGSPRGYLVPRTLALNPAGAST